MMQSDPSCSTGSARYEISDMPQEILQTVFKYLSARERNAVKLVCRYWFEICNLASLSNGEVLNCLGIYQLSDIYSLLNRSTRRFLNLKFVHVTFKGDTSFWKNNGSRIRSIVFKDCCFSQHIFGEIIILCRNLFSLSLKYSMCERFMNGYLDPVSDEWIRVSPFDDLARLVRNEIVREHLNSLKIDTSNKDDYIGVGDITKFHQLFPIFPRLKTLKIKSYGEDPENILVPVLNYLIDSTDRIEKLKLHLPYVKPPSDTHLCFLETLTAMERLTDLSIGFYYSELQEEDLRKFLHSKQLKSFGYAPYIYVEQSSLQSLLLNSNVEHFKLKPKMYSHYSTFTKPLFEKLMSSGLKSCTIYIGRNVLVHDPESSDSCSSARSRSLAIPNLSVYIKRKLSWEPDGDIVQLLKCLQNRLLHLQTDEISVDELLSLSKYQRKLKSLVTGLTDLVGYSADIFKDVFNQFSDIECLELDYMTSHIFLQSLSPKPALANLKYLKIDLLACDEIEQSSGSDLLKIADAAPFLEALYVQESGNFPIAYLGQKLCTKLSRLRFLRWEGTKNQPINRVRFYWNFFSINSSLRVLYHEHYDDADDLCVNKYFFDTVNKKVIRVKNILNNYYTFAKPRMGGLGGSWIEF